MVLKILDHAADLLSRIITSVIFTALASMVSVFGLVNFSVLGTISIFLTTWIVVLSLINLMLVFGILGFGAMTSLSIYN
jgi:hypothetical protein